jgi:catechol 2,3-dioxygenase-like lactoylglutathione lyase family enzyme
MDTLHHVALSVQDIDQAIAWYTTHFDCRVSYRDSTWALLQFANLSLALVLPGQHPPHVGLLRDDAARFGPLVTHRDGSRSIYLNDPSGNAVEVLEATSLKPEKTDPAKI